MILTRRGFNYGLVTSAALTGACAIGAKAPSLTSTSQERLLKCQQDFIDLRFGMFIHFNMAAYEQREWGDPKASPKLFNPTHLDTDQWARAAHSANMGYGCLTTKHHDGFCLWPTATASPSVEDSSCPHDVVRSYVDSFCRQGLKVCLYFSILDLRANIRAYQITPKKIAMIKAQLTELLTGYGEITALIFDGWNAGWSRIYYDQLPFRTIYDHVKSLQPNCLVADHNAGQFPAPVLYYTDIKEYEQHAGQKIPADSLVPSQSGTTLQGEWFWKLDYPTQELRSARQIVDEWLVPFNERHCNLILNVAPNREGRFDDNAISRLEEIGRRWKNPGPAPRISPPIQITTPDLAFAQPSVASSSADTSGPDLANDNDFDSFWTVDANQTSCWLEIDFPHATTFNTVAIIEPPNGRESDTKGSGATYRVQRWHNDAWGDIVTGRFDSTYQVRQFADVSAERVRLTVTGDSVPLRITEFGIYNEPAR